MRPEDERDARGGAWRPGLTLTELLIALLLTSLVVIGAWRFFGSASATMSVFNGVSIVDERLALAADLLASDARRAGMFGTPNSDVDPMVCPRPAAQLVPVEFGDGDSVFPMGLNVNVDPDVCIFMTPHVALTAPIAPVSFVGAVINFGAGVPATEDAFNELFSDHTLRITSPNGFSQFVDVTDVNFDTRSVTVSPTPTRLEDTGVCGVQDALGLDHEITVLTRVRYQIIPHPDDPTEDTLLVREELDPSGALIPGTRLAVAENVVDLQCWGNRDSGAGTAGSTYVPDDALGDSQGSLGASDPIERLRIFVFSISARTDREFAAYSFQPKAGINDLLSTWDVDGDVDTAALTLTVGQQVEVSSLVVRRL